MLRPGRRRYVERYERHGVAGAHFRLMNFPPLDVLRRTEYHRLGDLSFRCRESEALHSGYGSRKFRAIEQSARTRLARLHAATSLDDLAAIPGNRLEALKGNRDGQHSVRINDQWRICFVWREGNAYDVQIIDYH